MDGSDYVIYESLNSGHQAMTFSLSLGVYFESHIFIFIDVKGYLIFLGEFYFICVFQCLDTRSGHKSFNLELFANHFMICTKKDLYHGFGDQRMQKVLSPQIRFHT